MRNTEPRSFNTDSDALAVLLTDAKKRRTQRPCTRRFNPS